MTMNPNNGSVKEQSEAVRPLLLAGFFLLLVLTAIYWPSFQSGWYLDDFPNIVENTNVQVKSLAWNELAKSIHGRDLHQQSISRPLAYFSFAANHYLHGDRVFGYHLVNLFIHYLAAVFLFLFIHKTMNLPSLKEQYGGNSLFVGLFATLLWATHPIQVTAVTYIVQRMASMASMFYIMACYFYLRARTSPGTPKAVMYFICCTLAGILSLASKENAAMLPLTLLVYDILLLQANGGRKHIANLKATVAVMAALLATGLYFTDLTSILAAYDKFRPYTIAERLLTEPRVLLFYLSLMFYPASNRFTMLYDMNLSRALWEPWTTPLALLFLLAALGLAFYLGRRKPLWAFCIFFFYLNHLIESSFISLEPIFEHRNYLPSMLLFVPVAIISIEALKSFSYQKIIGFMIGAAIVVTLAAQGHTTFLRNRAMQNPINFWRDNIAKSPDLSRPHAILGKLYLDNGLHREAVMEIKTALEKNNYMNNLEPVQYLTYLGNYYLEREDRPGQAMAYYLEALEKHGGLASTYDGMAMAMLRIGNNKLAEVYSLLAVEKSPFQALFHSNLALVMLKTGNPDGALSEAQRALALNSRLLFPVMTIAEALRMRGQYSESIEQWNRFIEKDPRNLAGYLALAELYSLTSRPEALNHNFSLLEGKLDKTEWLSVLDQDLGTPQLQAYNPDLAVLRPLMREYIDASR